MFWKKKVEQQQPEHHQEKEEQPTEKRKMYSLEGILRFNTLNNNGYKYCLEKKEDILNQMEKTDPYDLPDNVSDERYDKVADKYYYLSNQYTIYTDAAQLFDLLGPKKGGYTFNIFDKPISMQFKYHKSYNEISDRDVYAFRYEISQGSLCIAAKEVGGDIVKHFAVYKVKDLKADGVEEESLEDYLKKITNDKIYEQLSAVETE